MLREKVRLFFLKRCSYTYKTIARDISAGDSLVLNLKDPEEREELIFLTKKESLFRPHIYIHINEEVISLLKYGVYLGKSLYELEIGEDLPINFPCIFRRFGFLLHKEDTGFNFNLITCSVVNSHLFIKELKVNHLKGYVVSTMPTIDTKRPYHLKFNMYKRLGSILKDVEKISIHGQPLLMEVKGLIDRTIYRITEVRYKTLVGTDLYTGVKNTPWDVYRIKIDNKENIELLYDSSL